jgi:hypothetical protein
MSALTIRGGQSQTKVETMNISPLAGKLAPKAMLVDLTKLEREYYQRKPDIGNPAERVSFGTSGHRGSSLLGTFNESHILAITQAICDYRRVKNIGGPLYMGKDTHALSNPAQRSAIEVLAANGVDVFIQPDDGVTPTPVISHQILVYNRGRKQNFADGIVVTPSHNPPEDGGFKYNPTNGGAADTDVTGWVQDRANELLKAGHSGVKRLQFSAAMKAGTTHAVDFMYLFSVLPARGQQRRGLIWRGSQQVAQQRQPVVAAAPQREPDAHQHRLGCRAGLGPVAAPDFAVDHRRADRLLGPPVGRVGAGAA